MSNENYTPDNIVEPVETYVVSEPVATTTVADQAFYTPTNVPAYVPQKTVSSGLASKVGIGALSAVAGGVLTWAAMHAAAPNVVAIPEAPVAPVAPVGTTLHDGTFYSGVFAVNPNVDLQLAVHVTSGRITDIVPDITKGASPVSDEINEEALPQLIASAINYQNGEIDMVSGATGTTNAFRESLQAALNQSRAGITTLPAPAPIAPSAPPVAEPAPAPAEGGHGAGAGAGQPNLTRPGLEAATGELQDGVWEGSAEDVHEPSRENSFGKVQVTITTAGGRITEISATYPGQAEGESGRSLEINEGAVPELIAEALEKQNAELTVITGATYTAHAFAESLQWALNSARD